MSAALNRRLDRLEQGGGERVHVIPYRDGTDPAAAKAAYAGHIAPADLVVLIRKPV